VDEVETIGPSLSGRFDVTMALPLRANSESDTCDQGQTHGHAGFLLEPDEAQAMLHDASNAEVIRPYMTADEFLSTIPPGPQRYIIDFHPRSLFEAKAFKLPFRRIESKVLADRKKKAEEEEARNKEACDADPDASVNHHHQNFLKKWWLHSYPRMALISKLKKIPRYVACGRVTKRPIFVFRR